MQKSSHPEIELRNVDIIFGKREQEATKLLEQGATRDEILTETETVIAVCEASLSVQKGDICVIMGLSGSGKSTLLRAINGLNQVTRGQVLLNHDSKQVDVAKISSSALRQIRMNRVSMVFQQFALLPWRTVAENVGLGLEFRGMKKSDQTKVVAEKLEMVGLLQWRDKYAHELSGGMQQRVGLARAFATDADILLMDEPFSALDPLIRSRLQDELLELQKRLHKTVLFVSHDLDEALKLGTFIAIMESGRIVQFGTPEEIVLNPVNQYVADFVAHMNPVGVLRAKSIMTPISRFNTNRGNYFLEDDNIELKLVDGCLSAATRNGSDLPTEVWSSETDLQLGLLYRAATDISMKSAIEIRHASNQPVILCEKDGTVAGVVSNKEIYSAILHKREST